jgi:hypothetical protein
VRAGHSSYGRPMNARAVGLIAVVAAAAGGATPAGAATISGSVSGATLPAKGTGLASVRAVAPATGIVVAAVPVRSGRFVLHVTAGSYVLLAATTPFRGHPGVDRKVGSVKVRSGTKRKLRLSLRRHKAAAKVKATARAAAEVSFVSVTYPAVWVQHFTVSGPQDASVLRKGIADMLISQLGDPVKKRCDGVLVEREHLDVIIAEQKLSQGPKADPTQRIPSGHLIGHNRVVSGTLTISGTTATLTATVTNTVTGVQRSVTHTGTVNGFFELEQSIVDDVAKMICDAPARYVGPVSGSIPVAVSGASGSITWSGALTLALERVGPAPSGSPPGDYAYYRPTAGTMHVVLDLSDGQCTGHGETDVTADPTAGNETSVQQGVKAPTYTLYAAFGASPGIPFAWSGPPDTCANDGTLPFGAGFPALATAALHASSSTLAGSSTDVFPGLGSVHREWSLAPQG